MEPRVTKHEKKLQLSYELPHRIHCSRIYPVTAPNGSTVILYGHDRGFRVLWRGGRRLKAESRAHAAPQTNGIKKNQDVIVIDDDDDEPQEGQQQDDEDLYETEEDEQDPDCPYPGIVQDVEIELDPQVEVLRIAVPTSPSLTTSGMPRLAKTHIFVALGLSSGRIMLMTMPLAPPKSSEKDKFYENSVSDEVLEGDGSIVHDLDIKLIPKDDEELALVRTRSRGEREDVDGRLLLAAVSTTLNIWTLDITKDQILKSRASPRPMVHSTISGSSASFHPSSKSTQVVIGDRAGAVRIYAFSNTATSNQRPSSRDSASSAPTSEDTGRLIMAYHTPFNTPKDNPALARRKRILDASWLLGGRAIIALLEDGEWGIWDPLASAQAGKNVEDFALRGYLGSSSSPETDTSKQRKGSSKLAPMTPNTRKAKSDNLFSEKPKAPGIAAVGGISVASGNSSRSGQVDESVVMWYGTDVYSIPSVQSFWQRSTNSVGGSGFGSLYAPGLTHVSDINTMNENITSIAQSASSKAATSGTGPMNIHRDLIVSAEHRLIILQSLRPSVPSTGLFQQAAERPASRDQRMLDAGELDIGGMDRMLDSMADGGRPRKVGFAR